MLADIAGKIKAWIALNRHDLYMAVLIFLVSLGSFGLGRLSVIWPIKEPITVTGGLKSDIPAPAPGAENSGNNSTASAASSIRNSVKGRYVASKSGAYYHYPWCAGALRIKEENKIWFQTKEEAERRGYKPAGNCPGL